MSDTPTPRTDEALIPNADFSDSGCGLSPFVHASFARQLERELVSKDLTLKEAIQVVAKLEQQNAKIVEALSLLYEETADYIRINHLGDVHHNKSMQMAHEVLHRAKSQV